MADRFQLFRLSLTPRRPDDLLTILAPPPLREDHLRQVFGREQQFQHRGNPFVYLPVADGPKPFIVGQIGRPFLREENLPPEHGFAVAQREAWRAAVLALDPRTHPDGQKVSFSRDTLIGEPPAVLRAFVKHLNEDEEAPYHIEIEPIFNTQTFWAFAEEHKGQVTSLRFEFVTPNMFGTTENIDEALRSIRQEERAELVDVKFRSQDGLNTDTERIRESVEYAGRGTGKILAFAKGGRVYNSRKQAERVTIDDESDEPLLRRAMRRITEVLGFR